LKWKLRNVSLLFHFPEYFLPSQRAGPINAQLKIMKYGLQKAFIGFTMLFMAVTAEAQFKLYEDTFNGGVVTGGYSNGATVPSGSGSFNVSIPVGSTIRRAYLIAARLGNAPDVTVTLNGAPFTFSAANIVTTGFTTIYGGNSSMNAINITASINPLTTAYTIAVPVQNTVSDKYPEFYLYIAFDNAGLPPVTSVIYLNTLTAANSMNWPLTVLTPINTSFNVGLGILAGYAAAGSDCENVNVNGMAVGNFSGMDFNASSAWGAMSGFQYYNGTLTGYNDDNANQAMSGPDALSNIAAIIPNNTTSFPVLFTHCGGGSDNHVWGVFLNYGGGVVLDAKLLHFTARAGDDNSVDLAWDMQGDDEIERFVVERSHINGEFVMLEEISPVNGLPFQYKYKDSYPLPGQNWYRIRYTGANGAIRYSEVVSVMLNAGDNLFLNSYPNPIASGENFILKLNCEEDGNYTLLQLPEGKEIRSGQLLQDPLGTNQTMIPTSGLPSGIFLLKVNACGINSYLKLVVK
jgi:hypothetical protein